MNSDTSSVLSPETKNQRLFFALWPSPELSRELYRVAGRILKGEGRRVPPENIHLTLAFLGSVAASFRQCAEQAASAIQVEPFTLMLEQIGCWPKPGIFWVAPRHTPEPLLKLVQKLNAGLSGCGYAPESRPYAAHVTLARQVHRTVENPVIEPMRWGANRFSLVQSCTHAEGARYEIVRSWEFSPPAP